MKPFAGEEARELAAKGKKKLKNSELMIKGHPYNRPFTIMM